MASSHGLQDANAGNEAAPPAEAMRKLALQEYESCRQGIDRYDDHLFRIRQWNIALAAVALAGIIGLAQVGGEDGIAQFQSSVALFVFTAISLSFWLLDALNKSLQMVHIHNSRDIEKFLRGTSPTYIGPTISLRFQRKEKRHWVGTVKNMTDETVMLFHGLPIVIFWAAVLIKLPPDICIGTYCDAPDWSRIVARIVAVASLGAVVALMLVSLVWKHGRRNLPATNWRSKYFLRPKAARRRQMYETLFQQLNGREPCACADARRYCDHVRKGDFVPLSLPPFRADFHKPGEKVLLFVDRLKIYRDPFYLEEREKWLKNKGYTALWVKWTFRELQGYETMPWLKRLLGRWEMVEPGIEGIRALDPDYLRNNATDNQG